MRLLEILRERKPACPWCGIPWPESVDALAAAVTADGYRCPTCGQVWTDPVAATVANRGEFEGGQASCPHCGASLGPRDSRGRVAGGQGRGIVGLCRSCNQPFILEFRQLGTGRVPTESYASSRFAHGRGVGPEGNVEPPTPDECPTQFVVNSVLIRTNPRRPLRHLFAQLPLEYRELRKPPHEPHQTRNLAAFRPRLYLVSAKPSHRTPGFCNRLAVI